jgi:hypothetical protein
VILPFFLNRNNQLIQVASHLEEGEGEGGDRESGGRREEEEGTQVRLSRS